ncbi:unnamed protein product [Owenia fusiformis]|uniref:Uncharacterized protein n=1 Tax=Owenia fusiformis TaxID=6347 RepID=A0A8J1XIS5_OWEFU|nr:unnamed protein product [Owenia fusiformis]
MAELKSINPVSNRREHTLETNLKTIEGDLNVPCNEAEQVQNVIKPTKVDDLTNKVYDKPGKDNDTADDDSDEISIGGEISEISSISSSSIENILESNVKHVQIEDENGGRILDDSIEYLKKSAETLLAESNLTAKEGISFPKRPPIHAQDKPDSVEIYKELLPGANSEKDKSIQSKKVENKKSEDLKEDTKDLTKDALKDQAKENKESRTTPKKTSIFKRFSFSKKRNSEPILTVKPKGPESLPKTNIESIDRDSDSVKDKKPSLFKRMSSIRKKSSNKNKLDQQETMSVKSEFGNDSPPKADTPRSGTFSSPRSYDSLSSDGFHMSPRDDLEELRKAKQKAKQDKPKSLIKKLNFRNKKDRPLKKLDDTSSLVEKQSQDGVSLPVMSAENVAPYEQDISNVLAKFGVAPKTEIEISPNYKEGEMSDTSSVSSRTNSLERKPKTEKKKRFTMKRFGLSKKAKSMEAIGDLDIIDSENDTEAKDDAVDNFESNIKDVIKRYSPEKIESGMSKDNKIESLMDKKKERKTVGRSFSFGFRKDKPKSRDALPAKHSCVDLEMSSPKKTTKLTKPKQGIKSISFD